MSAAKTTRSIRWPDFIPFAFGISALSLCAIYEAQRSGLLFTAFARFLQSHLDAIGGAALGVGVLGAFFGLLVIQLRGNSRLVTVGILLSVAAMLGCLLLPL